MMIGTGAPGDSIYHPESDAGDANDYLPVPCSVCGAKRYQDHIIDIHDLDELRQEVEEDV